VNNLSDISIEHQEELLEHLWVYFNEETGENRSISLENLKSKVSDHDLDVKQIITELLKKGDIKRVGTSGLIKITSQGTKKGLKVVRRHRLAERMLVDILNLPSDQIETTACSWEHVLKKDVETQICTLLGHPSLCPHLRSIPSGDCCKDRTTSTQSAILALADTPSGYNAVIAYIATDRYRRLQKLMGFGLIPGTRIRILRKTPGTVVKVDETVIALENDVTNHIYLRQVRRI
jgi:DtxR family Mn-dependent transcriptional regulator